MEKRMLSLIHPRSTKKGNYEPGKEKGKEELPSSRREKGRMNRKETAKTNEKG